MVPLQGKESLEILQRDLGKFLASGFLSFCNIKFLKENEIFAPMGS